MGEVRGEVMYSVSTCRGKNPNRCCFLSTGKTSPVEFLVKDTGALPGKGRKHNICWLGLLLLPLPHKISDGSEIIHLILHARLPTFQVTPAAVPLRVAALSAGICYGKVFTVWRSARRWLLTMLLSKAVGLQRWIWHSAQEQGVVKKLATLFE